MKRLCFIDIEANHNNWNNAEIIEIAFVIHNEENKIIDHFQTLIKPIRELDKKISELTGITQNDLRAAPEFHEVAHKIFDKIKDTTLVAHKAQFDFDLLKAELKKLDLDLENKTKCTLKMSQNLIPGLSSYSLNTLNSFLGYKAKREHRALDDVESLINLHHHLMLLSSDHKEQANFLKHHKKLIKKQPSSPGVIVFKRSDKTREIIKSDNLYKSLNDKLVLCSQNQDRIVMTKEIKVFATQSLIEATLKEQALLKERYEYCLYTIRNSQKKIILRVGKTQINKRALFYFKTKKEATTYLKEVLAKMPKKNLIYQDSEIDKLEILKNNNIIESEFKKKGMIDKNYLIRSHMKSDGTYSYILIKKNHTISRFQSKSLIEKSNEIIHEKLKFRALMPNEYMALTHSLQWVKNQKSKTDIITELKEKF